MTGMRLWCSMVCVVFFCGCSFDPYGEVTCAEDGLQDGQRVCRDGIWVNVADGLDGGTDGGEVMADGGFDAGSDASVDGGQDGGDACIPETEQELCEGAQANCGTAELVDRCGVTRAVDCGTCTAPQSCGGGGTPNLCGCEGSDDAMLCADAGAECGTISVMDPACGAVRDVACGGCSAPDSCGGAGTDNQCGCTETEQEFCSRLGATCGTVDAPDRCGTMRSYDCGSCTDPEICGGAGAGSPNTCGCDATTVCAQLNAECGVVDTSAQCSNVANVDCGGCGANGSCQAQSCDCDAGYEYDAGLATCVDVNECTSGANNCSSDATCTNTAGGFTCTCNPGYAGSGQMCADIDECMTGTAMCDANATCTNTPGAFGCACNAGYTGDGMTCTASFPTIGQVVKTADTLADPVATPSMTAQSGSLYVAVVNLNTNSRTVQTVSAFGQNFTRLEQACSGDDEQVLEIWTLELNTAASDGPVTVDLNNGPYAISVIVFRIDNVAATSPVVQTSSVNTSPNGSACSGGTDQTGFTGSTTPANANSLTLLAWSRPGTSMTLGGAWTLEDSASSSGASFGRNTDLSVYSANSQGAGIQIGVNATFGSAVQYIGADIEIAGP